MIPESKAKKLKDLVPFHSNGDIPTLNEVISHAKNTKKFLVPIKKELKRRLVPFHSKSKIPKLSCAQLEDLPDEVILKIFSFLYGGLKGYGLNIKEILKCGQVSKRFRSISNDKSFWLQLNLGYRDILGYGDIPYRFLEKAFENGCIYLSLACSHLNGVEDSKIPLNLKYLVLSQDSNINARTKKTTLKVPKGLLKNCHTLQKLAMENLILDLEDIEQIGKNGQTLTILDLGKIRFNFENLVRFNYLEEVTEAIKRLFKRCVVLEELKLDNSCFCHNNFTAMANNLTPNILKVDLSGNKKLKDEHVNILIKRCTKITELNLSYCNSITNNSVESIATHLNSSLEKLDVSYTKIDSTALLQLRSVGTLKVRNLYKNKKKELKNLRKNLPHVSIYNGNEDFCIASPIFGDDHFDGFWEIKSDIQELFM